MAGREAYDSGGISMRTRIGKVTNVYPSAGKVRVEYEDEGNTSVPLSLLTMNQEYSMPAVGEKVVTIHLDNGSSKGFVLGTYYGGGVQPKANGGYRKDFGKDAYAVCIDGLYRLFAGNAEIRGEESAVLSGGGAVVSADGDVKVENADMIILEAEADIILKAPSITIEGDAVFLKCAYGVITVDEVMRRLERMEDQLGLPHTI